MKIGIIGVGVVGGATAQVLKKEHELYLYDKYKPEYNAAGNLEKLALESEVVFICVPTPMKKSGEIDYSAIFNSIESLREKTESNGRIPSDLLVTIRSTAVSGTTDKLAQKYPFRFAFNPEFLTERNAQKDMENTDRIVIGANDEKSKKDLLNVYKPLFPNAKYATVPVKAAEMIKYAANVMLAGQIALANEIYQICNHVGVDYTVVKETILQDSRIGRNLDVPGPDGNLGFGGKCFPKDLNALIYFAREHGYDSHLLVETWRSNLDVREERDWYDIPGATSENPHKEKD